PQRLGAYSEELQLMVTLIVEMESVLANGRLKKLIGAIISEFKITIRQYQEFETKLIKIEKELEQL
ncbi:hypothetical protein KY362_06090, partial [Candidatus Woesearchaeota archaeon]|nr:hypothetical protein [Candidatus Woesearchaeota archaeon]